MNLLCTGTYLHSIYIVLGITSNLEMIQSIQGDMHKLYTNTKDILYKGLEHGEFCYPQGSWNQFPVDTETIFRFQNFPQRGQLQSKSEMHKLLYTKQTDNKVLLYSRKWHPTPVLLPGKSHGLRILVGYSPWGHKESDTTERLHFTSLYSIGNYIQYPSINHNVKNMHIYVSESLCCTPETNTTL